MSQEYYFSQEFYFYNQTDFLISLYQMDDLARVKKFCSHLSNDETYPNSLKNLDGISDATRNILVEMVNSEKTDRGNKDLYYPELVLLSNFLEPKPFQSLTFDKILGPISICQMSSEHDPRIFYIFGDIHERTGTCKTDHINMKKPMASWLESQSHSKRDAISITKWIEETVKSSPVFIDVYLESPYEYKNYRHATFKSHSYLMDSFDKFYGCLITKDKSGVCETSRFHYADIRQIFERHDQQDGNFLLFRDPDLLPTWTDHDTSQLQIYYDYIIDSGTIVYKRIQKQIDNISDIRVKKILEGEFWTCVTKNKKYLTEHFIFPSPDLSLDTIDLLMTKNRKIMLNYTSCLMDYYLMARCFRTHQHSKDEYSRPSYNNIIYVGEDHALNYVEILQKLGFTQKYTRRNVDRNPKTGQYTYQKNFQCLNVSGMTQPMFHQRYRK